MDDYEDIEETEGEQGGDAEPEQDLSDWESGEGDAEAPAAGSGGEDAAPAEAGGADAEPRRPAGERYLTKRGREVTLTAYDFRQPIQLSKGFFRSLSMVSDAYAKLLTLSMSNYLHVPVTVKAAGVQQVMFEEHTKTMQNPSFLNIVKLSPIKIPAMIDIDLPLVLTMIEKLLGSHSLSNDLRREFTAIEMRIARKIATRMLTDLREAMLRILEVTTELTSIEHNPDFTYIMSANDPCILMNFTMELGEFAGTISICISLASLDAEMGTDGPSPYRDVRSEEERLEDEEKLGRILDGMGADLVVELARMPISVSALEALEVGSVLNLRKQVGDPLSVRVGGNPVFLGKMGRNHIKSAVKITEILWPKRQRFVGAGNAS